MGRWIDRSPPAADADDELAERFTDLGRAFLMAVEKGSEGEALCQRIRDRRVEIAKGPLSLREKVAEFEAYITGLGLFDHADRFARRRAEKRKTGPRGGSEKFSGTGTVEGGFRERNRRQP